MKILLAEDDPNLGSLIREYLEVKGYHTVLCANGEEALKMFLNEKWNICIFDVMMPNMDGFTLAREIRKHNKEVPIVFLTAKSMKDDAIEGFKVGADDYITKPYRLRELVARMRAVLRRAPLDHAGELTEGALQVGDIALDPEQHEVVIRGEKTALPLKEFELLHLLLANAGRVLPRETLIDRIWGNDYVGDTKTLDVHIKRLRAKIESDPANPAKIITIRGLGYKFERIRN